MLSDTTAIWVTSCHRQPERAVPHKFKVTYSIHENLQTRTPTQVLIMDLASTKTRCSPFPEE